MVTLENHCQAIWQQAGTDPCHSSQDNEQGGPKVDPENAQKFNQKIWLKYLKKIISYQTKIADILTFSRNTGERANKYWPFNLLNACNWFKQKVLRIKFTDFQCKQIWVTLLPLRPLWVCKEMWGKTNISGSPSPVTHQSVISATNFSESYDQYIGGKEI